MRLLKAGSERMEQSMKINGTKVRELRETRAWSQEQLASAAGLSVRTVQRAESESTASRETRVCLAAALGIDHGDLNPATGPTQPEPAAPVEPAGIKDEADLILRVTGGSFLCAGASMLVLLGILGGWGTGNPVLWIGFFCSVTGLAFLSAGLGRKRIRSRANHPG
jgi:transcriptional regulator with XRE-family HTH domain